MTARWIACAALAAALLLPAAAATWAAEAASTQERKAEEKAQAKRDKKFNREVMYRHVIGPNVLAIGPFSISLFVRGQPVEGKLRVAIQATSPTAKQSLEGDKWAVNGVVYPLAVRMFEQGRPSKDAIRTFKNDAREQLSQRYPDLIEDVFIESIL